MRGIVFVVLIGGCLGLGTGCTWNAKVKDSEHMSQLPEGESGLLIPVEFESQHVVVGKEGCSLILRPQGGVSKYDIPFRYGDSQVFASLDPDVYYFEEVFCGKVHLDMVFLNIPMVIVLKHKISIAVGMKFSASTFLERNFVSLFDKTRSQAETLKALQSLPISARTRTVSAYTGKPITLEGLETPAPDSAVEVRPIAGKNRKPWTLPSDVMSEVRHCRMIETKRNPLALGNVVIEANYSADGSKKILEAPAWNVLNPEFPNCLISAVRKFQPSDQEDIQVQYIF